MEVALAISRGNLHKFVSELVSSGLGWLPIKMHLQGKFLECGSATMAKHTLTLLKQSKLPIHEYIAKFGEMTKYAYCIKATDSASTILASNFIEGVQNLYIKISLGHIRSRN